jgi:hypothetical protein
LYFALGLRPEELHRSIEELFESCSEGDDLYVTLQHVATRVWDLLNPLPDWWEQNAAAEGREGREPMQGPNYAMERMVVIDDVVELSVVMTSVLEASGLCPDAGDIENAVLFLASQLLAATMSPEGIYYRRLSDRAAIRRAFKDAWFIKEGRRLTSPPWHAID